MNDFMSTMRPWLLTPGLVRRPRRRPQFIMGIGTYMVYTVVVSMFLIMILSMTVAWDAIVLLYGGMFYAVAALIKMIARRTHTPREV